MQRVSMIFYKSASSYILSRVFFKIFICRGITDNNDTIDYFKNNIIILLTINVFTDLTDGLKEKY